MLLKWEEGHLHDAIHITLGNLFEQLDYIPKDFPIVLQCRTGLRSAIAASILQRAGIKEVVNLKGLHGKKKGFLIQHAISMCRKILYAR